MVLREYLRKRAVTIYSSAKMVLLNTYRPIDSTKAGLSQISSERQLGQEGRGSIGLCSLPEGHEFPVGWGRILSLYLDGHFEYGSSIPFGLGMLGMPVAAMFELAMTQTRLMIELGIMKTSMGSIRARQSESMPLVVLHVGKAINLYVSAYVGSHACVA